MDRGELENLRDLPNKTIERDIILQRNKDTSPLLAIVVPIKNSAGVDAKVRIEINEKTDAKTINVFIAGVGPICRLDIDTKPHGSFDESHKHSLKEPDCSHPSVNLSRKIENRNDLSGKTIEEVFNDFCSKAKIKHIGKFLIQD